MLLTPTLSFLNPYFFDRCARTHTRHTDTWTMSSAAELTQHHGSFWSLLCCRLRCASRCHSVEFYGDAHMFCVIFQQTPKVCNEPKIFVETENFFPCLDTKLVWSTEGNLQVHFKPNQQRKCLNTASTTKHASKPSLQVSTKDYLN